jgi:membrane glycosyltransferase
MTPPAHTGTDVRARYVERLGLPAGRRERLLRDSDGDGDDVAGAMARLHRTLAGDAPPGTEPARASLPARLRLAGAAAEGTPVVVDDPRRGLRLLSAPPLHRASMTPGLWPPPGLIRLPSWLRRRRASTTRHDDGDAPPPADWQRAATVRRVLLLGVVLAQSYFATSAMVGVLPYHGTQPMEIAVLILFAILIGWVSAGFWTALAGFVLLVRGRDRYAISARHMAGKPLPAEARTAIVMPICNEDVASRVRRPARDLRLAGADRRDRTFRLLRAVSDSSAPEIRVAEREAWLEPGSGSLPAGRVYYRRRHAPHQAQERQRRRLLPPLGARLPLHGRARRRQRDEWRLPGRAGAPDGGEPARRHRADRAARGRARARCTRASSSSPRACTARCSSRGLHFWQLGESHYWGHNAIIRVAPFMSTARWPPAGQRRGCSGGILSHDFVEAALMRRAGWARVDRLRAVGQLRGRCRPNLLDELKRDRRWCQGNLINSRLFFAQGLHPAHRAVFVTGVMAYLSAPLWFGFLLLSTVLLAIHTLSEPTYFTAPNQLFPLWPEWHPARAIGLFGATATLLFLPKILSVALIALRDAKAFGGTLRLAASMLLEIVFSALLAPIRMLFHTKFIGAALVGWAVHWKSPPRDDAQTTWGEALTHHGGQTVLGLAWLGLVYWLDPAYLWWLLPVAGAMALSIPISVFSSRVTLGRRARAARLFLIPEESHPPRVLRRMRRYAQRTPPTPRFVDAVVDPLRNAIACAADVARTEHSEAVRRAHAEVVARALREGPAALDDEDRNALLRDARALSRLHFSVWSSPVAHPDWLAASLAPAPRRRSPEEAART